jgi:hypothetical protein
MENRGGPYPRPTSPLADLSLPSLPLPSTRSCSLQQPQRLSDIPWARGFAAGLRSHLTLPALTTGADDRPQEPAPPEEPVPAGKDGKPGSVPEPGPATAAGDVNQYDLSGFPRQPTSFEEQQVLEAIHSATTSALKADAHARLAQYYEEHHDAARARAERAKADYWRGGGRL